MENKNLKMLVADDTVDFDSCLHDFIKTLDEKVKHHPNRDDALDMSIKKHPSFKLAMRYDGWNCSIVLFYIQ